MNKIFYYIDEVETLLAGKFTPPVSVEIDPSTQCMLSCSFCFYRDYLEKHNSLMDMDVYTNLVDELLELKVKSITLTGGGEPLIHPNINSMIYQADVYGIEVGLITNGILLNRIMKPDLLKFIRISLDASNRNMYHGIKGMDYFDHVITNIKNLREKTDTTIGISYVVCDDNKSGIEEMKVLADRLEVDYLQIKPVITNSEVRQIDVQCDKNTVITQRYAPKTKLPCVIAGLVGVVATNGDVYYCCQHRGNEKHVLGNLNNSDFRSIWSKRQQHDVDVSKCPPCRYMNYAKSFTKFKDSMTATQEHRNFL